MAELGTVWKEGRKWSVQEPYGINTVTTKRHALVLAGAALDHQRLQKATREYEDRQERRTHPDGKTDKAGRWYPSSTESQPCCRGVRGPTRSRPWSYMTHCRTVRHIASLFDVDEADLRKAGRKTPAREGGEDYFKAVAVGEDGRWLSIFDGETEYRIGETLSQRTGQYHSGGYYVYSTKRDARNATVPKSSVLADAERVVLRVRAGGSYCRYDNGKLAFSQVTPLGVVA